MSLTENQEAYLEAYGEPMGIPEMSESQLKLIVAVCLNPEMSVFSQSAPADSDPLALQAALSQGEMDVNRLVALNLLKDITADHLERVEKTNVESGRTWRVFEVTALARAMFQAFTSPAIN